MAVQDGSSLQDGAGSAVRRAWCVWLAVSLVLLGLVFNTFYLFHNCPIDLSGDEAHYWEWSRHLDYGYYSKPPGIAWVIAAAIRIGDALGITGNESGTELMPVMRMAAVLFGTCSGLISLLLARRIFRDDRAALAVIVLSAAVPMFAVGGLLITIDSPMYLCWGATVYCLWRAIEKSEIRNPKSEIAGHESRLTAHVSRLTRHGMVVRRRIRLRRRDALQTGVDRDSSLRGHRGGGGSGHSAGVQVAPRRRGDRFDAAVAGAGGDLEFAA